MNRTVKDPSKLIPKIDPPKLNPKSQPKGGPFTKKMFGIFFLSGLEFSPESNGGPPRLQIGLGKKIQTIFGSSFFLNIFHQNFHYDFFQNLFSHSRSRISPRIEWWYSQAPNRPREEDTDDFRFPTFRVRENSSIVPKKEN